MYALRSHSNAGSTGVPLTLNDIQQPEVSKELCIVIWQVLQKWIRETCLSPVHNNMWKILPLLVDNCEV